ncbi:erf superfamily [Caudoviricetes sp.]|nr:erf superfamily [Caudoviricetes sp.]UOF78354.1 erf superfamily [Bacteriophage sp.]
MKVYQAINAVQAELCKIGIAKSSTNTQGAGYKFRGIDAVYNVLSSIMAQNGLVIVPRMLGRTCEERTSKSGGALFYVTVEAEFDLVSAEDGSKHTARTFGEAMDSGDKATNKAMSAAYKYMAFQTFAIPTEGDNDADAHTHEVARKKPSIENSRLTQAIQKIKEGAYTTDKLRDTFALTAEQEKILVGALANE